MSTEPFKQFAERMKDIVKRNTNGVRLMAAFIAPPPKPRRPLCKVCNNEVGSAACSGRI